MCNCNSNPSYSCKFTQRSNTSVDNTDKDLTNFLASEDFAIYTSNFASAPIAGQQRLITFNNTTIQALWLPTINSAGEKQVLFAFYKLGTTNYLTYVANTRGELTNLLDMNGEWNLFYPTNRVAITGAFTRSAWNVLSFGPDISPSDLPFLTCFNNQLSSMGPAGTIACGIDLEVCLLLIAIDCAIAAL